MSQFVVALEQAQPDIDTLGGKAASLARLTAAGLAVPRGFVVSTAAYRRMVDENALQPRILQAVSTTGTDPASLDRAATTIGQLFDGAAMPDDLAHEIDEAYAQLGDEAAVAVRSSATAEDLPELSFAGQQETYLNIRGSKELRRAVKRCWASLWTARAIGYRNKARIAPDDVALAVAVQTLVEADAAGVMFTANPVSGARDEVVVNAAWGLGEAIVSGLVTPDTFVLDKSTGAIKHQDVASKQVMTVGTTTGTAEQPVPAAQQTRPVLSASQAAVLARAGATIEQLYGQPMDVEWAFHGGTLALLQARPITALPEPPAPPLEFRLPDPKGKYARSSVIELLPDPLSPLFATLGVPAWNRAMQALLSTVNLQGLMAEEMLITINDYAYYDITTTVDPLKLIRQIPALIPVLVHVQRGPGALGAGWASALRKPHRALGGAEPGQYAGCRHAGGRARDRSGRRRPLPDHPERHPAGGLHERGGVYARVRAADPPRRRPTRADVHARLRQHPDSSREVSIRPGRVGPRLPGARRARPAHVCRRPGARAGAVRRRRRLGRVSCALP
jgi:hypothetical protein